jgi:hypothetical protein
MTKNEMHWPVDLVWWDMGVAVLWRCELVFCERLSGN